MKRLALVALVAAALSGCATPPAPPKPAVLLTDIELCVAGGRAHESGDSARFTETVNEVQQRIDSHRFGLTFETCQDYAQQGINAVDQERVERQAEAAQSAANWRNFSAGLTAAANQMQAQQAQQQAQQQAAMQQAIQQNNQMQQQMEMQRQTQALQSINRQLGGW